MYRIGDRIAHPLHGAGVIERIESKKVSGTIREYYVVKMPVGDMIVMIPKETSDTIGVRPIIEAHEADSIIAAISGLEVNMTQNWSRRYRENMIKIKSGDLMEVAAVIKGLVSREVDKGLSTGERKMLHSAKQILISEIVLSQKVSYEEVEARLSTALA
ncbi:MAG: CarD family transcriptional regulator [Oscillospiraceae bacterium]|nr:CarD family transcriptional regulator [Oscillospiraceae bacterium]